MFTRLVIFEIRVLCVMCLGQEQIYGILAKFLAPPLLIPVVREPFPQITLAN
jgi:hypothetical protein